MNVKAHGRGINLNSKDGFVEATYMEQNNIYECFNIKGKLSKEVARKFPLFCHLMLHQR